MKKIPHWYKYCDFPILIIYYKVKQNKQTNKRRIIKNEMRNDFYALSKTTRSRIEEKTIFVEKKNL